MPVAERELDDDCYELSTTSSFASVSGRPLRPFDFSLSKICYKLIAPPLGPVELLLRRIMMVSRLMIGR